MLKKDRKTLSPPLLLLRNNDNTYTESAYVIPVVHFIISSLWIFLYFGDRGVFFRCREPLLMSPIFLPKKDNHRRAEREPYAFFIGSSSYIACSILEKVFFSFLLTRSTSHIPKKHRTIIISAVFLHITVHLVFFFFFILFSSLYYYYLLWKRGIIFVHRDHRSLEKCTPMSTAKSTATFLIW